MKPVNQPIIGRDEVRAVAEVAKTGMLTSAGLNGGKKVQAFENAICKFTGAKYAVAVNSGTAALQASLLSLGIGQGDEVVVPSFTFVATANAVRAVGAKPVFVDIEEYDYTMSPEDLQQKITNKTKAIIPVHLYGHAVAMEIILDIAKYFDIPVIEDACQSLGTIYNKKHTGTIGDIGCYSFYPGKIITTGEGGVIVTDNIKLKNKLLMIRNHGMVHGYDSKVLGFNLRMPELNAAIGIEQMKKIELFIRRRRENALYLTQKLDALIEKKDFGLFYPIEHKHEARNQILYTVATNKKNRDTLVEALNKAGYGATVYYPIPVHKLPVYNTGEKLQTTEDASKVVFSIPIHPNITKTDINKMVKVIENNFTK